jgi:putative ABC transport system substrate-binding protein
MVHESRTSNTYPKGRRQTTAFFSAFKEGLREFGWINGKNIVIDVHWAPAYEFPQLAASLVKRNPAAIVGTSIPSTRPAKSATTTIPVVMSVNGDPAESGSWRA